MVVDKALGLALALPTGALFGIGYGTGVRIGYEQIYPLLFPKGNSQGDPNQVSSKIKEMYAYHDLVGGKEAVKMGMAQGINIARSEVENSPDMAFLVEWESKTYGNTRSNFNKDKASETIVPLTQQASFDDISNIINSIWAETDVRKLLEMRKWYKDNPNLMQIVRSRFAQLREQVPEEYRDKSIEELNEEMLNERKRPEETKDNIPHEMITIMYGNGTNETKKLSVNAIKFYKSKGYEKHGSDLVHPYRRQKYLRELQNKHGVKVHGSHQQRTGATLAEKEYMRYKEIVRSRISQMFRGQSSKVTSAVLFKLFKEEMPDGRIHDSDAKVFKSYIAQLKQKRQLAGIKL